MAGYDYGIIGLGTMGSNFLLNMLDNNFSAIGYDKDAGQAREMNDRMEGRSQAFDDLEPFMKALKLPRKIVLLVPAGKIVDYVLTDLEPHLSPGDIIVDSGNSFFKETQERVERMKKHEVHFMGMGISGGEKGARYGASLMPGGDPEAYQSIGPMLQQVSAKAYGEPCTDYMGHGAAGHYVKMVHNGIEYSIMQMLSETYHFLKKVYGYSQQEMINLLEGWNNGRLNSYLLEVTIAVLKQKENEEYLVDKILDAAAQKGTGSWTSQDAFEIGSPVPSIDAAVIQRIISSFKNDRKHIDALSKPAEVEQQPVLHSGAEDLEATLYAGYLLSYAQGFHQIDIASDAYGFHTDLEKVGKVWRGGCIIRAKMLQDLIPILHKNAGAFVMREIEFLNLVDEPWNRMKPVLKDAIDHNVPLPAFSTAFNYYLSFSSEWLPANIIQAQRDYFGAHTFRKHDEEGNFHFKWEY